MAELVVNQRNLTPEPMLLTQSNTAFIYKNAKRVIHGEIYVIQMENYINQNFQSI